MAEHRISAKLDLNTRDAQRSMQQAEKSSRSLERQIEKTNRTSQKGTKVSSDAVNNRKRVELIEREVRAVNKLAEAYEKAGKSQAKNGRAVQSLRSSTGRQQSLASQLAGTGLGGYFSMGAGAAGIYGAYSIASRGMNAFREEDVLMRYNKSIGGTDAFNTRLLALGDRMGISRTGLLSGGYQALSAGTKNEQEAYNVTRASAEASLAGGPSVNMEEMTKFLTAMQLSYAGKGGANFSADAMNKLNAQLFATTKLGKIEYKDLASAVGSSMSTASTVGVKQSSLLAYTSTLANKGITPSEADTAMNRLMMTLLAPTPEARKYAKKIGVDTSQERMSREGLTPVLTDVYNKLGGNVDELSNILGDTRSVKAFLAAFSSDGGAAVKELERQIENANYSDFDGAVKTMAGSLKAQEQVFSNKMAGFAKGIVEATGLTTLYGAALNKGISAIESLTMAGTAYTEWMAGPVRQAFIDQGLIEGETTSQKEEAKRKSEERAKYGTNDPDVVDFRKSLEQQQAVQSAPSIPTTVADPTGAVAGMQTYSKDDPNAAKQQAAATTQSSAATTQKDAANRILLASTILLTLPGAISAAVRAAGGGGGSTIKAP